MSVPVDVYVKDDGVSPAPIQGVVVGVYDPTTFAEIAMATTGSDGRASFVLNGSAPGTEYEIRLFKLGVRFANPFLMSVLDPPTVGFTNKFDTEGTLLTLPASVDPRRCRCTGVFVSLSNTPVNGAVVRFMAKADSGLQTPKIVDGNLVSAETLATSTDSDGVVSVDLIRCASYYMTFSGEDDVVWLINVPDRASVNLVDLIHPAPVLLVWDPTEAPGNAVSLAVGETKTVHYSVVMSDYEVKTTDIMQYLSFMNSDDAVMTLVVGEGTAIISGIATGSASASVTAKPKIAPFRIPDNSVTAPDLVVTVTP